MRVFDVFCNHPLRVSKGPYKGMSTDQDDAQTHTDQHTYSCPACGCPTFFRNSTTAIFNHQRYLLMGSSLNMTYRGDINREYVVCRGCGQVEHQYSAEARDQAREAAPPANRRIQLNRRKAATRRR